MDIIFASNDQYSTQLVGCNISKVYQRLFMIIAQRMDFLLVLVSMLVAQLVTNFSQLVLTTSSAPRVTTVS